MTSHHILLDFITRKILGYFWLRVQIIYLLTLSMEHIISTEVDISSASQEIPRIL
jgi:hypothetical protein